MWVNPILVVALTGTFQAAIPVERHALVRHGYELLPNERWLEELELDGRGTDWPAFPFRTTTPLPLPESTEWPDEPDLLRVAHTLESFAGPWPEHSIALSWEHARDPTSRFLFDGEHAEGRKKAQRFWQIATTLLSLKSSLTNGLGRPRKGYTQGRKHLGEPCSVFEFPC